MKALVLKFKGISAKKLLFKYNIDLWGSTLAYKRVNIKPLKRILLEFESHARKLSAPLRYPRKPYIYFPPPFVRKVRQQKDVAAFKKTKWWLYKKKKPWGQNNKNLKKIFLGSLSSRKRKLVSGGPRISTFPRRLSARKKNALFLNKNDSKKKNFKEDFFFFA